MTMAAAVGHDLSDEEWQRTRARLLEFAAVLRKWGREAKAAGRGESHVNEMADAA